MTQHNEDAEKSKSMKESLDHCNEYKEMFSRCFNNWYRHQFLRKGPTQNPCDEYFEEYQACLMERLGKAGMAHLVEFEKKE